MAMSLTLSSAMVDDIPRGRASLAAVAARLSQLMKASGVTVRELQARLEAEGVEGSKYSNVRRYVAGEGKSPPPLEWLDAAARGLRARAAWLAFGDGEPTEGEEGALREGWAGLRERLGQPGRDQIVLVIGRGDEVLSSPDRVVLIDASAVPEAQRPAYIRKIAAAASEAPPPGSEGG